jgi:hypothetical protein
MNRYQSSSWAFFEQGRKRFPDLQNLGVSMTRIKILMRTLSLALLMLGIGTVSAFAQFSSGVEGTVVDKSGAVVAGAKVSVTDTKLGITKTAVTNQGGYFRIDSIAASTYTVNIEMTGFEAWDQKDLTLAVGEL